MRAELLAAEAAHFAKANGGSILGLEATVSASGDSKRQLEIGATEDEEGDDIETKRRKILEESRDIDADSIGSEEESSEDDSEDDEDEEAELQRELAKIKAERAAKREEEVCNRFAVG